MENIDEKLDNLHDKISEKEGWSHGIVNLGLLAIAYSIKHLGDSIKESRIKQN